jgi:[NiFe] hydrogenase diaphorase moiety large subunit
MKKKVLLAENQPEFGAGLQKALTMKPADVVFMVRDSEIRGLGGAGFPTGIKWNLAGAASADKKYVICNADEGEPGTFKDRVLLTDQAERLLEGMAIGGYAIGSDTGIIYLRAEYPYLVEGILKARQSLMDRGLLGKNIQGTGFNFDVEIRPGAGAYVCGEETALIESMEGKRGEPRNKPPYPVNAGYLNKPTIVNNVETFCAVPHIVLNGPDWYAQLGEGGASGTKLFSISGDVERPGVYELPMGAPLSALLELAGAPDVQAVQVGGASGKTVCAEQVDKPLSFGDLPPGGSVVVFNSSRDMLEVLENFMEFFVHESCGQCTPCREGNMRLLHAVSAMRQGDVCCMDCLQPFMDLCDVLGVSSKCGLGQTSGNCFRDIVTTFVNLPQECNCEGGDA